MLDLTKAAILGAVQGITEFLPVSSTGHLILFEKLLHVSPETYGLTFDAALHIGTLFSLLWFFKSEWLALGASVLKIINILPEKKHKQTDTTQRSLIRVLLLGTIPAVFFGVLLEDLVSSTFRSPELVAWMLILFSFLLLYIEQTAARTKQLEQLKPLDSLIIGTAQAIALIPGVSRSGITIAAGMWRGMTRESAARFAFLLSAPIVAGAGGKKLVQVISLIQSGSLSSEQAWFFFTGMVSAAVFGYVTIRYFLNYLTRHSLYPFIIYRIVLGGSLLVVFGLGN